MAATDEQDWFTDAVWENPCPNGRRVLIFVTPIRHEHRVIGVCYLKYEFEGQDAEIMNVTAHANNDATVLVLGRDGTLVATNGPYKFGQALPLSTAPGGSVRASDGLVAAISASRPFLDFDGLGLCCVIECPVPTQADIERSVHAVIYRGADPDFGTG